MRIVRRLALFFPLFVLAPPVLAGPFASTVVHYTAGSNVPAGYDDPTASLGAPTRSTGDGPYDGDVTPFNAPYLPDQVVAIGAGGSLVVGFDQLVTDDPSNPFGIDLLIYGNAFLGIDFETGIADGVIFGEPARVSVSQDGLTWVDADGIFADALFPTLAYQDPTGPFSSGGTIPTSFTRPVDPSLTRADFVGRDIAQIAALYDGGAGGVGLDLADLGLRVDRVRARVAARGRRLRVRDRRLRDRAGARPPRHSSASPRSRSLALEREHGVPVGRRRIAPERVAARGQYARGSVVRRERVQLLEQARGAVPVARAVGVERLRRVELERARACARRRTSLRPTSSKIRTGARRPTTRIRSSSRVTKSAPARSRVASEIRTRVPYTLFAPSSRLARFMPSPTTPYVPRSTEPISPATSSAVCSPMR